MAANELSANNIARFDGTAWRAVGPGITGDETVAHLHTVTVDAWGNAYVGGHFKWINGVEFNHIAKWNSSGWSQLGAGVDGLVSAVALDGAGNLYVGGEFKRAGNVDANCIAKWDGTSWAPLGSGVSSSRTTKVNAIAVDEAGNVYAGGSFMQAGGTTVNNIAKWDGSTWSPLGTGMDGNDYLLSVNALALDEANNLYAAGCFETAGDAAANIAKWDGTAWSAVGTAVGEAVNLVPQSLVVDGLGNLYVGGEFRTVNGIEARCIAKWDGTTWSCLGAGLTEPDYTFLSVNALARDGLGNIYAGGWLVAMGGIVVNNLARWDGNSWFDVQGGTDGFVNALATDCLGNVYVGGEFTKAGNKASGYFAVWRAHGGEDGVDEGEGEGETDDEPPCGCFGGLL